MEMSFLFESNIKLSLLFAVQYPQIEDQSSLSPWRTFDRIHNPRDSIPCDLAIWKKHEQKKKQNENGLKTKRKLATSNVANGKYREKCSSKLEHWAVCGQIKT